MTVKDLHAAIIAALEAKFGATVTNIGTYRPNASDPIDTPAMLLEIEEFMDTAGRGDNTVPMRMRFTIHNLLSFTTPDIDVEIREMAGQVFRLVRRNKWGFGVDIKMPENLEAAPGQFKPGKSGYESWYVTWEQDCYFAA